MKVDRDEVLRRMESFTAECKRAGVKLTHQRMEVFREVARTVDHPDAETVYRAVRKKLPTISQDTVYRTLWRLMELGLVTTLGMPRERSRFDANMTRHHHFVCTNCGRARDVYSRKLDELAPPTATKEMGEVKAAHVEFRGICARCAKKKKKAT